MRVLGDIVTRQARMLSGRTALIDDGASRRYSFAELADRSARIANALADLGVRPGDRVAMLLGNCTTCAELPFGITMAGAIMVNVNERLKQEEVAYILADSGASVVVTSDDLLGVLDAARDTLPALRHVVTVNGNAPGTIDYETMLGAASAEPPAVEVAADATAMLIYTSGTTGRPKGVQLTHTNLLASATNWLMECYTNPEGVYLACGPYYHSGCISHLAALMRGMTVVPVPFEAGRVLTLVERYGVTDMLLVPTMIALLLEREDLLATLDLSTLQGVFYAAAPIPEPVLRRALERFGPIFVQMYGLTESSTLSTILRHHEHSLDDGHGRLASCGREVTLVDVRVGSVEGGECPPGERGEILIRGANVTPGYWGRPDATAEAIRDGWLHTGDIGMRDADGYIYIVDRKTDMIIVGGSNVYPREIEDVLHAHPAVAEASVIGIPHETYGETVVAVVALHPAQSLTDREVIDHCASRLAKFKTPRQVVFVDALPKTPIGKIDKATLRKRGPELAGLGA
ncbi:MAG TPA: long-chain fatty acid--CoA ligase [Mycobacteriales bacterium]|jgi:acyl-CoA synthetase (AMP-forming)/AMP-acid ligase II